MYNCHQSFPPRWEEDTTTCWGQVQPLAPQRTSHNHKRPPTTDVWWEMRVRMLSIVHIFVNAITCTSWSPVKDLTHKNEQYTWDENRSQISDLSVFVSGLSTSGQAWSSSDLLQILKQIVATLTTSWTEVPRLLQVNDDAPHCQHRRSARMSPVPAQTKNSDANGYLAQQMIMLMMMMRISILIQGMAPLTIRKTITNPTEQFAFSVTDLFCRRRRSFLARFLLELSVSSALSSGTLAPGPGPPTVSW